MTLATTIFIAVLVGTLIISIAAWLWFLKLGLRLVNAENITWRRLTAILAAVILIDVLLRLTLSRVQAANVVQLVCIFISMILIVVGGQCWVTMRLFQISFRRSFLAWLVSLTPGVIGALVALLIIKPFIAEAFVVPTNSMAPTLLGRHVVGTCSECGSPAYASQRPPDRRSTLNPTMICRDHFHITPYHPNDDTVHSSDRFIVWKHSMPQRWDLIVFRYPPDPSTLYVKRLIGLPGETIEIKDGAVWANGTKLTPPESIKDIKYVSKVPPFEFPPTWGSEEQPAKLHEKEYFVLGDFTTNANDSRLWPDHGTERSYAVPEENIVGVVTHIYWPPDRWRAFK